MSISIYTDIYVFLRTALETYQHIFSSFVSCRITVEVFSKTWLYMCSFVLKQERELVISLQTGGSECTDRSTNSLINKPFADTSLSQEVRMIY